MTQEEKSILLKDLCARLLYGVLFRVYDGEINEPVELLSINPKRDKPLEIDDGYGENSSTYWSLEDAKPYFRPMSSMTEEEKEELKGIYSIYIPTDSKNIGFEDYGILVFTHHLTDNSYSFKLNLNVIDWLNAHHFDYRNLIEKGLALKAPKDMYK